MIPLILGAAINTLAPLAAKVIGNAIAGKAGQEVAASIEPAITSAALQATGKDSVEAARDVLLRNPNSEEAKAFVQRINELATQLQIAQLQAETDRIRLANDERSSARNLLRDLAQQGNIAAYFMPVLTTVFAVGFFVFGWWLLTTSMGFDERRTAVVNIVVGALIVLLKDLIGFWTGSTSSSKIKDATIAANIPPSPQPQAPVSPPPVVQAPPPVVVVPPVPPQPPEPEKPTPAPEPTTPPTITPPGTPGATGGWRRIRPGAAAWRVTEDGVVFEGEDGPGRTIGEPVTVTRIWQQFGPAIVRSCAANGVPYLLAVACIATESGGKVRAILTEPDGRQSVGLMQTLHSTASAMMGRSMTTEELNDPAMSIEAGVRYIADRRKVTGYDPVLVAAAHNAGGVYYVEDDERHKWPNEFRIRSTSDHIRRFVAYFNDAVYVEKRDGWAAQAVEFAKQA